MPRWTIHTPLPVPAASLRVALDDAMLASLRAHGAIPQPRPGEPPVITPDRRAAILAAFTALGGDVASMRPQMDAAINAAVALAASMPDAMVLASLGGHDEPGREDGISHRLAVSVEQAPDPVALAEAA